MILLEPLTGDLDLAETIVVDDESSDRMPPGSAVKWWALDQGLRAARCDLALYLDADNLPRPLVTRAAPSTAPAAHGENP